MEWCPLCQKIKPINIKKYVDQWFKYCRDCNASMGMYTVEDANKTIVERDYYKDLFYKKELDTS